MLCKDRLVEAGSIELEKEEERLKKLLKFCKQ
jgi:hypothetical protein